MEKSVPFIEEFLKLLKRTAYLPWIVETDKTVQTSKKGIKELKKKPSGLVKTAEELEKEVKSAQAILEAMEEVTINANKQLERLDYAEVLRVAALLVKKAGCEGDIGRPPSLEEIKTLILSKLRITLLVCLLVAVASLLDPLEAVTRYPDSQHVSFDENNPFVKNFDGFYDVIARCLEKSRSALANKAVG